MNERIRVLVVDDSEFFGTIVTGELERLYDMDTVQTTRSEDALARLENGSFDCLVSDYDMPEMNGIELFETVRDRGFDLPFFLLTAAGSEEVASKAITAGIDDYFPKTGGDDQFEILGNRIVNVVSKRHTAANLERQRNLHETLWNVTQNLLHAGTRERICIHVCDELAAIDQFEFAWIESDGETVLAAANIERADIPIVRDQLIGSDGDSFSDLESSRDRQLTEFTQQDGNSQQTAMAIPLEHRKTTYGTLVLGSASGSEFRDPDRQSLSHLGTTVGHALAAVEMRREIELFQTAVEQAETAIAITDTSGQITYANSAFYEITGYDVGTLEGECVDVLATDSFDEDEYAKLWERVERGDTVRTEVVQRRKDGAQFVADLSLAPVSVGGELQRFILVESDITELKSREQRLEVLNRVIRHNLRNDLNVVNGNISLLLSEIDTQEAQEFAERAQTKIEDLLAMSEKARLANRIVESAEDSDEHRKVSISDIVNTVVEELSEQHPEADISVSLDATCSVPEVPLEHSIEELLSNALIHNESESPEVTVSTKESTTHDGMVAIEIADNGPGIPKAERQTLSRGHETDLSHSSSLGLWLVHWVVTFLGGELQIVESDDTGSTVRIVVPASGESEGENQTKTQTSEYQSSSR